MGFGGESCKARIALERFEVFVLGNVQAGVDRETEGDGLAEIRESLLAALT